MLVAEKAQMARPHSIYLDGSRQKSKFNYHYYYYCILWRKKKPCAHNPLGCAQGLCAGVVREGCAGGLCGLCACSPRVVRSFRVEVVRAKGLCSAQALCACGGTRVCLVRKGTSALAQPVEGCADFFR